MSHAVIHADALTYLRGNRWLADLQVETCYNSTNHIRSAPAQLPTAGGVSQDGVSVMTTPIVSPDSDNLKRCAKCGDLKPREAFSHASGRKDGLNPYCKDCNRAYRTANRDEILRKKREYHHAHADRANAKRREYRLTHHEQEIERQRQRYAEDPAAHQQRNRVYREANKERLNAASRAYHAEHKEQRSASNKAYSEANREELAEYHRQYRVVNRDRINQQTREWRQRNPDRQREWKRAYLATDKGREVDRAKTHRRRAHKAGNGGSHTAADLVAVRAAQTDSRGRLICWICGNPIKDNPHLDHFIPLDKGGTNAPGNLHYTHAKCNLSKGTKLPHEIGRLV